MKLFAAAIVLCRWPPAQLCGAKTPRRCVNQRDTMIIPSEHNDSPFDFNHMAAGNDKSDELGVPYYQKYTQMPLARIIPRSSAIRN